MGLFKKKTKPSGDPEILIDISSDYVSTGSLGAYILNLYETRGFMRMGYTFDGDRVYIYALNPTEKMVSYFKDRCPGMIEDAVMKFTGVPHSFTMFGDYGYVTYFEGGN